MDSEPQQPQERHITFFYLKENLEAVFEAIIQKYATSILEFEPSTQKCWLLAKE